MTAFAGTTPLPLLVKKKRKKKKKKNGLTPAQAAERRAPVQDQGTQMVQAGELTAASILLDSASQTQGDPILFLDAGDVYLEMAIADRDIAAAETAKMRAWSAEDILYFQLDSASDPDYRLVENEEVATLLARSSQLVDAADTAIEEIEAEQEALVAPQAATSGKAKGDGKVMRIAGLGLVGLGVAGLGVGFAGLIVGRVNQNRVEDPAVYGTEFDEFDTKGRRGNVLAGVGLAVGAVAVGAGVALFIIGRNRGKQADAAPNDDAGPSDSDDDPELAIVPTGRGLALTGRF
ncbi:MAG: hypothetical protein K0V04_25340 [Deltaproteobacteria bacterium]|nr:hypothetical protein [Deltaproteobacteria bacterium]